MKKAAKQELFFILKALVDKRVPQLKKDVNDGAAAVKRIASLQTQVNDAQRYMCNNRYDRADAMETMAEIAEYESEISQLRSVCSRSASSNIELDAANAFYRTYKAVEKGASLEKLRREYSDLESRADKLDDLIFSCEVNMNPFERSVEVCNQSAKDMEFYREEYKRVSDKMRAIAQEIRKLNGR